MIIPTIYEKFDGDRLMWDVYSRLLKDRVIWVGTEIDSAMANTVVAQLLYLDMMPSKEDIKLYINSPGGHITAGMAIYDTMNYVASDVSTICMGQAASMGAFLLSAGAKGKRFVLPNSEVMIHQPLGGYSGQASDVEIHARHLLKLKEKLNRLLAAQTGQTLEQIEADTNRDNYLSAEEAVAYGLADAVLTTRDKSLYDEDDE